MQTRELRSQIEEPNHSVLISAQFKMSNKNPASIHEKQKDPMATVYITMQS